MKLPHLVIYTDRLPDGVAGTANGPLIRLRPAYRGDAGLHAHEYQHVIQWYQASAMTALLLVGLALACGDMQGSLLALWPATLGTHPLAYLQWPRYRLWCEVQAYKEQVRHGLRLDDAARRLMSLRYQLGLQYNDARRLLGA
jgi:hypothetical protein